MSKKVVITEPGAESETVGYTSPAVAPVPVAPAVSSDDPPPCPVLIEGVDGGDAQPLDGCVVDAGERQFSHNGVRYEHVAETPAGVWIYRAQ